MERTLRERWAQVAREHLSKANQGTSNSHKRAILKTISKASYDVDCESKYRIDREMDHLLKAAQASLICGKYHQSAEAFEKAAGLVLYGDKENRIPSALLYCEAGFCREMIFVGHGEDTFSKFSLQLLDNYKVETKVITFCFFLLFTYLQMFFCIQKRQYLCIVMMKSIVKLQEFESGLLKTTN